MVSRLFMDGLGDAKRRETPCSQQPRAPASACLGELGCAQLIYINSSPLMMSYCLSLSLSLFFPLHSCSKSTALRFKNQNSVGS